MFQKRWVSEAVTAVCLTAVVIPQLANADMLDDGQFSLGLRNFYLDRDYHQHQARDSKVGSWSQGFDAQWVSGYTDSPLAIGLDLNAQYAVRLDSTGNDGSLPFSVRDQQTAADYSRAGATLKMRYSKTELKVGDHRPQLPIAYDDSSRQLDTIYQGAMIESQEIEGLKLTAGRFWSVVTRESSNHEKLYKWGTSDALDSEGLDFAGGTYNLSKNLQLSYYYGLLHDIYQQHYAGLMHRADLGNGYALKTDIRYFNNSEAGHALDGKIDNRSYGTLFTLTKNAHMFGLSYQRMLGESVFPTLNGYIPQPYLVNWSSLAFVQPAERSWSVRYGYDFVAMGVPGLTFYSRYTKGTHWDRGGDLSNNQESERNLALAYVVQSGPLKNLAFEWRRTDVKTRYGRGDASGQDYGENRLITTYVFKF
ncbi:OprD family outer membrane porin [Pseudomonas versuta]|uniref:Porin n=1 Tax=Pseudomonas versuta TaxID=1788301 RepID=A0A0M3UE74_9PSED|nr:OprD family outer membrane porin [Pseudomonas versuta]ALE88739.1 porin [Pseudomonas versuta]OKA21802.1 porin [Pseudomonas versuta]OKA29234.1 porin [Pseudomonas versuta]